MYKLLIVDDEVLIADMLADLFRQAMPDELEVYKAYSAKEAQEWLDLAKIDIVLSDIKMPGVSGLELLNRITANWPSCRVVFLTGYREFDYIYAAIQHNGVRFMLKTADDEQIVGTIREVLQEIEESHRLSDYMNQAKRQIEAARPLLQNEMMQECLYGYYDVPETADQHLKELEIPLSASSPTLMVIGRFDSQPPKASVADRNDRRYALQALAANYFPQALSCFGCIAEHATSVWLLQVPPEMEASDRRKAVTLVTGALECLQSVIRSSLEETVSFAMSGNFLPFTEISEVYRMLKQMLNNRIGMGTEMILCDRSLPLTEQKRSAGGKAALKQMGKFKLLEEHLELGRKQEFVEALDLLLDYVREAQSRDDMSAIEIYFRTAVLLTHYMNRFELAEAMEQSVDLHPLFRTDDHPSWNAAAEYLLRVAEALFALQTEQANKSEEDTISRLKTYIDAHLHEDLSLTKLAGLLYLNSSYLSRLFKQATDRNVSDYITDKRIEKAKDLLKNSTKKIHEISLEVGYDSQQSFTRFFKNAVGQTPQEFRESFVSY